METQILPLRKLIRVISILAFGVFLSFFVSTSVFSQTPTPEEIQTTLNLSYPIEVLGGCENLDECASYCEDPINQNSCMDFARQNGFYQDDPINSADSEFWQGTQNELGCNSAQSCAEFCSQEANFEACESFAKRNEIPGGYIENPDDPVYLEVAREVLGCDNTQSCVTFCDDAGNSEACTNFANQVGLLGGTTEEGPAGCQTGETCSAYCSDPNNFEQCVSFTGANFSGPGGCSSEESCRAYCEENSDSCRSYAPGASGVYVPVACPQGQYHGPGGVCTALGDTEEAANCVGADQYWNGESCEDQAPVGISTEEPNAYFEPREDMGNCTTPGACYDFCQANQSSEACSGFDPAYPRPVVGDDYTPYLLLAQNKH